MNTQHNFVIDRPLAQHCAELFHSTEIAVDPEEQLDDFVRQFCRQMAVRLAWLTGGKSAKLAEVSRSSITGNKLANGGGGPRSFLGLTRADGACPALAYVEFEGALSLMDQAFGGDGVLPDPLPESLPRAAEPVLARLARQIAETLQDVTGSAAAYSLTAQGDEIKKVIPFSANAVCQTVEFEVCEEGRKTWKFALAFDAKALPLPDCPGGHEGGPISPERGSFSAIDGACSEIPLTVDAVLARIMMPLARVAKMKPGDVLPIAMPREVALRVAGRPFARGPIGTQHDQIALQLTQMETPRGNSQ